MGANAELSKMLFEAREAVEMYADVVYSQTGRESDHLRDLTQRIDSYRVDRGWKEYGFGGEDDQ